MPELDPLAGLALKARIILIIRDRFFYHLLLHDIPISQPKALI